MNWNVKVYLFYVCLETCGSENIITYETTKKFRPNAKVDPDCYLDNKWLQFFSIVVIRYVKSE